MNSIYENTHQFSSPFIGRDNECTLFQRLTRKIVTDGRFLFLISGSPGIGKSRLLEELYKTAQALSYDGAPPVLNRSRFREETMLSEDALLDRIADRCRDRPGLLFIDNLHLGEERFFIQFDNLLEELRDRPFLAVAAYQELPAYRKQFLAFLSDIKHIPRVIEHRLEPLSETETSLLIEKIVGEKPSRWLVVKTREQTGGIPLFIQEIARLIVQHRGRYEDDIKQLWEHEVPKAVHKAVSRRLVHLSDACLRQIQILSLAGESFTDDEIGILCTDIGREPWRKCLQEAIDYGFIHTDHIYRTVGKYRFSHHVIRDAITASIPETEIGLIARETAVKLESAGLGGKEGWALRLAGLWSRVPVREARNGYHRYIKKAAKKALHHGEYELVADLLEKIIDPAVQSVETDEEAELLYDLGEAKSYSGYRSEASTYFHKAFTYYKTHHDISGMVRIASRGDYIRAGEPGYIDYYRDILDVLPTEPVKRGRILYRYASSLFCTVGDFKKTKRVLEEADTLTAGTEEPDLKIFSLVLHAALDCVLQRHYQAFQTACRGLHDCKGTDPVSELILTGIHFMCLPALGRSQEALRELPRFLHAASQVNDRYNLVFAYYHMGRLQTTAGMWKEARDYFDTGAALYPYLSELLAGRTSLEYMLGNYTMGDMYRRRLLRVRERMPEGPYKPSVYAAYTASVRALCSREQGDMPQWIPVLQSIMQNRSVHPFITIRASLCLLFAGIILKDRRLIKETSPALEKPPSYYLIRPYKLLWALGLGRLILGRPESAISYLQDALQSARWYHDRPMEACILYDVGRSSLLEHPSLAAEKRKNRATALLYEALEISVQLGMRPLTERINDLLTQKMPSDTLPDRFMEVLTNREREVATCLERGLSNKEIAETLNISVHTVINHIRHILEKTGTSSRGAAVAALKRTHSLFSDQTRS